MESWSQYFPQKNQKILYTVLNWGLGHSTRSIPIIRHLIENGNSVTIGSDGEALTFLRDEFPDQPLVNLASYKVRYPFRSSLLNGIYLYPNLLKAKTKEYKIIKKWIANNDCDYIISDHRYGCYHHHIPSLFITHQVHLHHPIKPISNIASKLNRYWINKFDTCYILDNKITPLAGKLSTYNGLKNAQYIGNVSRLIPKNIPKIYDLAIILSGPEPSRTRLEERLLSIIPNLYFKIALVRGVDSKMSYKAPCEVFDRLSTQQLNQLLNQSKMVLCRAGYSSIMDLFALQKRAILIPTPGQSEQEYLADHLASHPSFSILREGDDQFVQNLENILTIELTHGMS